MMLTSDSSGHLKSARFFSHSRTPSLDTLQENACHAAWLAFCQRVRQGLDLTTSNPTHVGLPPIHLEPETLLAAFETPYEANPNGLASARQAIADFYGPSVHPQDVQLFASTSEAIASLLKLACQPGDEVIAFSPTYPLLDCLCALESVELQMVPLQDCAGEWAIDFWQLERAYSTKVRAILVVSPNNPTGHRLRLEEFQKLADFCTSRGLLLIIDEVFASYAIQHRPGLLPQGAACLATHGLVISLSGLSKVCGLPQHKLAWGLFGGDRQLVDEAKQRMAFIIDTSLSTSGWVQQLCPKFLASAKAFAGPCLSRIRSNLTVLLELAAAPKTQWRVDLPDAGWNACLRLPAWAPADEDIAEKLASRGIRVFPGAFFGYLPHQPTLVLSLIVEPSVFTEGLSQMAPILSEILGG